MAAIANTSASTARFIGADIQFTQTTGAPAWWAELGVHYGGPDEGIARPVVFKRLGVSALAERAEPDLINTYLAGQVKLRTPTLLKAYPTDTSATLSLQSLTPSVRITATVGCVSSAETSPLIVSPTAPRWPDQGHEPDNLGNGSIDLPWLRVTEGRLGVTIPADPKHAIAKYLGLKADGTLLDGVRVQLTGTTPKLLQAELSPEGLEFEAELPDPTADFNPGGSGVLKVIVRLEITAAGEPALRLTGAAEPTAISAMEERLRGALADLQMAYTPASVRFDVRPLMPAVRWLLEEKVGVLRAKGKLSQGLWTVLLDEATVDVRVTSGDSEPRAVAAVGARTVMLSREPDRLALRVNARAGQPQIAVQFDREGAVWKTQSGINDTSVSIDLDAPARRLGVLYTQARATAQGEEPPFIFLPVQDGWLQAPIPPLPPGKDDSPGLPQTSSPKKELPPRMREEPARPALSGQLLSNGPAFQRGRTLVIESAGHAEVTVSWKRTGEGAMKAEQVTVRAWDAAGELRGYVFAAETSPTAEEGVPNLVAGEAATSDLPLAFGPPRTSGRWWDATFEANKDVWTLDLPLPQRDGAAWRAWMRDPLAAFVGIVALTRSARGSARPSPSRDLLPLVLEVAPKSQLRLAQAISTQIASAAYLGEVSFAADPAENIFDAVMPTLPGVQFRPQLAKKNGNGQLQRLNRWTWAACWRHGLPALDEFFGGIEVPKRPAEATRQALALSQPVVTALRPIEMLRTWLLGGDRVSLSWAQDRFAFEPWLPAGGPARQVAVEGWAQPYRWMADTAISLRLPPSVNDDSATAPPLGSYTMDGNPYALASALAGIGREGIAERFRISTKKELEPKEDGKIAVLGMAISTYDDGGLRMDARGLAIGARFERRTIGVLRTALLQQDVDQEDNFSLLTLAKPLRIQPAQPMRNGLAFYARDLPVTVIGKTYAFDGSKNHIENATGAGGEVFDRIIFGRGLHEWRLFEEVDGKSMRRYDIGWGPLSFVPLRLWKFEAEETQEGASLTALWVLGRLELSTSSEPWAPGEPAAPFGPEEPYKPGELFMMKLDDKPLRLEPVMVDMAVTLSDDKQPTAYWLDIPKGKPTGNGMAYVRVDAVQQVIGGSADSGANTMPLLVGLTPVQGGKAKLQARLFGDDRALDGTVSKLEPDVMELSFEPAKAWTGVARASTITVTIANTSTNGTKAWRSTIRLGVEISVGNGKAPLLSREADGRWTWMNVSGLADAGARLRISHESGAITLHFADRLKACEPLLGWPVEDLEVKGFLAHVFPAGNGWPQSDAASALFLEIESRSTQGFALRHCVAGGTQEASLDWETTCTSVIRWPRGLSVEHYAKSADWVYHSDYVRMVSVRATTADALPTHTIALKLRGQSVPVDALGKSKEGLGLMASWTFLAPAQHKLAVGNDALTWETLDRIEILPAAGLKEVTNAFAFAPRYRSGKYRKKETASAAIPHPGVAQQPVAHTGFDDEKMPGNPGSPKPVIRGVSVTVFIAKEENLKDPRGLVAQVPWLADTGTGGALGEIIIAQCSADRALDWRLPTVDAELAARELFMHRLQRELPLPADADAREVDAAITNAAKILDQRPVTQAWFESFDKALRLPMDPDQHRPEEMPFFPETLLVFDKLWQADARKLEARSIFAKDDESGAAWHVRLRRRMTPPVKPREGDRRIAVDIIAADRVRLHTVSGQLTVPAEEDGLLGPDAQSGRGRARIRELVKGRIPSPRVIFCRAELEGERHAWQVIQMPPPPDDFGARLDPEPTRPVPPSAALGWPSAQGTNDAGRLGPVGGVDEPVVSSRAGLAGRGSTFRLPAWAPGIDGPEALYLSFTTHVVFQRPAQVVYTGPAARHLSPVPARVRAPLASAAQEALRKLVGAEKGQRVPVAALCPPSVERTSVGDRPGELHTWSTAVVVPAEGGGFDPDNPAFGRPATSSPVLARQHRAPRSPLLPADGADNISMRRRTYVSVHDKSVQGLEEMKLFGVPATVLRLYSKGEENIRCSLEIFAGGGEDFRLGEGWGGQLQLFLTCAPLPPKDAADAYFSDLVESGLLPAENSASTAQVRIGNDHFPFETWTYERQPQGAILTFAMKPGEALMVLAKLQATNVDVPVAFDFQLAAQGDAAPPGAIVKLAVGLPAAIREWPVRNLTIPLQRAALTRATLSVDLQTVAFGDPAYDRQLSAPTFESPPTTLNDGQRLVIVADREEYNLDETVLLAAGARAADQQVFVTPAGGPLQLTVRLQPRRREGDTTPPSMRDLRIPQGEQQLADAVALAASKAYALHPRSLVEADGSPVRLEPGDQLALTVTAAGVAQKFCVLMLRLTDLPSIAPPPSVYSLVTAQTLFRRASVAVHACGPLPDALEYPQLEQDLFRGMVQRRALFIWQWSGVEEAPAWATLVKVDRSGGAQLPQSIEGFVEVPASRPDA
jgi:hypothetical protein